MSKINFELTMTVAFVCVKETNGSLRAVGTAFFMNHVEKSRIKLYAVTAKHVIDSVKDRFAVLSVFITYNGLIGREEQEIPIEAWVFHPDSGSKFIDVAVARFDYDFSIKEPVAANPHQVRCLADHLLYGHRSDLMPNFHIPALMLGEEVVIVGLFAHYSGITRNIPIVRMGNIAAKPSDLVETKLGPMEALLIEIRSIGGLSGSPVIAQLAQVNPAVIGLIHGHFDQADGDLLDIEDAVLTTAKINAGIAIVVPARYIEETLAPLIQADFKD